VLFKFYVIKEMEKQFTQQFLANTDVNTGVTILLISSPKKCRYNFMRSQVNIHLPKLLWSHAKCDFDSS
jgi:hypothetical protein